MSERSSQIADYVQYVVEQLVDDADGVNVTEQVDGEELFVDIEVNPSDRGRVIGKNGRLIRSLRVVVRAAAGRDGTTAMVELVEDDDEADAAAGSGSGDDDATEQPPTNEADA